MKSNSIKCFMLALCTMGFHTHYAQSNVIHFEDVAIPEESSSLSKSVEIIPEDYAPYSFISNDVTFYGSQAYWGNFSGFDCSKNTDTIDPSYVNDNSSIVGRGANETSQYAVAYLQQDYGGNPAFSIPEGVRLSTDTTTILSGFFVTNTTLTYKYILSNLENISSYQLIIRSFVGGENSGDSIIVDLYKKNEGDTFILKEWYWVDLESLGELDSLTFQLFSDDITTYTPFYFALDEMTIKDAEIPSSVIDNSIVNVVLSPNPVLTSLNITNLNKEGNSVVIFDISGNKKYQYVGKAEKLVVEMENWPSGVYFLNIQSVSGQIMSRKIVKL